MYEKEGMGFVGKLHGEHRIGRNNTEEGDWMPLPEKNDNLTSMQDTPMDLQLLAKQAHQYHRHHRQNYATIDFSPIEFFVLSAPCIYFDPYHIYYPNLHPALLMPVA